MSPVEAESDSASRPEARAGRHRWRRRLLVLAAFGAASVVAVRLLLPTALERGVPYAIQRYAGLPAELRNVDLWLLRGAVALEGVSIGKPAPGEPGAPEGSPSLASALLHPARVDPAAAMLHWERIYVQLDWGGLLRHELHLRQLSIDALSVRVAREADGRIDPLAHTKLEKPAEAEPPAEPPSASPGTPWSYAVDRFEMHNPELKLDDVKTGASLLEFGLDSFSLTDIAFAGQNLGLGAVGIERPRLRVQRDLLLGGGSRTSGAPPAAKAAAQPKSKPPGYRVQRVAIERADFTLLTDAGPLEMALALEAQDISAVEGERFPIKLELQIEKGKLELDGKLGILPPSYDGRIAWNDLPFGPMIVASRSQFRPWIHSIKSFGDLAVKFSLAADASGVDLQGRLGSRDFSLGDPDRKEVGIDFQTLEVVVRQAHIPFSSSGVPTGKRVIALESVRLVDPKIHYARPTPQLDKLLGSDGAPPAPAEEPKSAAEPPPAQPAAGGAEAGVDLSIGAVDVSGASLSFEDQTGARPRRGGVEGLRVGARDLRLLAGGTPLSVAATSFELGSHAVRFEDETVEPPYRGGVQDLSVAARSLAFPELRVSDVRLRGIAPDGGTLKVSGSLAGGTGDFTVALEKLALPPFNPYASSAAGYRLAGAASLQSKIRIRGARYDTHNQITLHKLGVSSQAPGDFQARFGIPLDLALALLRDPSGDISLSVPVAYDEKGVSTGVGSIVASALRQALLGALTSPLKMIGAVLPGGDKGGGELSLEPLGFAAGTAALADGQPDRLGGLAQLLASRPALKLSLSGRSGPADRPQVAEQMLVERAGQGEALPDLEGAGFFARRRLFGALEKRARGDAVELSTDDQALLARYVGGLEVPAERMTALAQKRAETVRDALVTQKGVAAARLELAASADGEPSVVVGFTSD